MKVGDSVPVALAGHVVAQARVKELSDGKAILDIPATRVTMAVRTELDAPPVAEPTKEVIIDGVDRVGADESSAAETTEATAPVETPAETSNTTVAETSSVETVTAVEAPVVESAEAPKAEASE